MMTVGEVKQIVQEHEAELRAMHVKSLAVFGSVARGENRPDSDVDLLAEFEEPVGYIPFFRLEHYLDDLFAPFRAHVAARKNLFEEIRDTVIEEAVPCLTEKTGASA